MNIYVKNHNLDNNNCSYHVVHTYSVTGTFHILPPFFQKHCNVNCCCHYGKQYGDFSKKKKNLKIALPYDPAIPLLGIYPDKAIIQKDTCTLMFITALFTIAKTWKQPKCPSADDWIKKMWYMYTMEYYSALKRMK